MANVEARNLVLRPSTRPKTKVSALKLEAEDVTKCYKTRPRFTKYLKIYRKTVVTLS